MRDSEIVWTIVLDRAPHVTEARILRTGRTHLRLVRGYDTDDHPGAELLALARRMPQHVALREAGHTNPNSLTAVRWPWLVRLSRRAPIVLPTLHTVQHALLDYLGQDPAALAISAGGQTGDGKRLRRTLWRRDLGPLHEPETIMVTALDDLALAATAYGYTITTVGNAALITRAGTAPITVTLTSGGTIDTVTHGRTSAPAARTERKLAYVLRLLREPSPQHQEL